MKKITSLIVLLFLFVGCNKNVTGPQILTSVSIVPSSVSVVIGGTLQFTATAKDQGGTQMSATMVWTSSNTAIGSIDVNSGLFTAISAGVVTVTVTAGGSVSSSATVTVTTAPPVLTSFTVTPLNTSVAVGGTVQYVGYPKDQYGNNFNTTVSWSSSNTGVGTISQPCGLFSGVSAGISTITGTAGGIMSSSTTVTVTSSLHNYFVTVLGTSQTDVGVYFGLQQTPPYTLINRTMLSSSSYLWTSSVIQLDEGNQHIHFEVLCPYQDVRVSVYRDGVIYSSIYNHLVLQNNTWWVNW